MGKRINAILKEVDVVQRVLWDSERGQDIHQEL